MNSMPKIKGLQDSTGQGLHGDQPELSWQGAPLHGKLLRGQDLAVVSAQAGAKAEPRSATQSCAGSGLRLCPGSSLRCHCCKILALAPAPEKLPTHLHAAWASLCEDPDPELPQPLCSCGRPARGAAGKWEPSHQLDPLFCPILP